MFVAALLDAFPELHARVMDDARAVLPAGVGVAVLTEGESGAVRALRFGLQAGAGAGRTHARGHARTQDHAPTRGDAHDHDHGHLHDHGEAAVAPVAKPANELPAHAGTYPDMRARIANAALHPGTAAHAAAILALLARAEAAIHRVAIEDVHFHEIADWDSLLDVVAAGSLAAALDGAEWTVSPLPLGGGLVRTQHGMLPVPAPATAALLEGFDWRDDGVAGERVTPTGAAILRHLARPGRPAGGRLMASGTGAGTRSLRGMPNVLRALVFEEASPDDSYDRDTVAVIAFEVDDMTGEEIGTAAERLRAAPGVLDVSLGQLQGKKGRPATAFRLLARPDAADAVARACFEQTSTIGLRLTEERRLTLARAAGEIAGVDVKRVARPGGATAKAESDALTGATLAARRAAKVRAEAPSGQAAEDRDA
nr:LarC family nickel insertion protein [Ancylobacter koreensis]